MCAGNEDDEYQEQEVSTRKEEKYHQRYPRQPREKEEDKKDLQVPEEEMEDRLKEGCKIPRYGMEDRQKGNLVTGSKEDTNRLSEDGEVGKVKASDEVINLSFHILFNEHEHMLTGDEQRIVLRYNKWMLREKTPKESDGGMKKDGEE